MKLKGRINRKNYILGFLLSWIFIALILIPLNIFILNIFGRSAYDFGVIALMAVYLYYIITLHVRRGHDLGYPEWYVLALLVPILNFVYLCFLLFKPNSNDVNLYGKPDTKFSISRALGIH